MKIRLLVNYRGRETREKLYPEGYVTDMEDTDAQLLIRNGWAEEIESPPPKPEPPKPRRGKAKEDADEI